MSFCGSARQSVSDARTGLKPVVSDSAAVAGRPKLKDHRLKPVEHTVGVQCL